MAEKIAPPAGRTAPEPAETGRTTENSQIVDPNTATAEDVVLPVMPAPATAVPAPDDVEPEPETPQPAVAPAAEIVPPPVQGQ